MAINPPTVSAPSGTLHLKTGTAFWFNLTPNHTSGETLQGVEVMIAEPNGSVRYTPAIFPFIRTDLSLSSASAYSALLTLPNTIPQNHALRAWARTYSGGVWSDWNSCGTDLNSPNTLPVATPNQPIGAITATGSVYAPQFNVQLADANSDNLAFYQLDITGSGYAGFNSGKVPMNQPATSVVLPGPTDLLAGTTYTWKVRFWDDAWNAATDADPAYCSPVTFTGSFTVPTGGGTGGTSPYALSASAFTPSGQNNVPNSSYSLPMVFSFASSTTIRYYRIVIRSSTGGVVWDSAQTPCSLAPGANFTIQSPSLLVNTHYLWKVQVWDSDGNTSAFSPEREFWGVSTAAANAAPSVHLISPVSNNVYSGLTPTLQAQFSDPLTTFNTFTSYQVQVIRSLDGAVFWNSALISTNSGEKSSKYFSLLYGDLRGGPSSPLLSSTTYTWRAQVFDDGGLSSGWSVWAPFRTQTIFPNSPTGLAPSGTLSTTTPTFTGTFSTPAGGAGMNGVEILVWGSDQTTLVWDSTLKAASGSTFSVLYTGPTLIPGEVLFWQARTRDTNNLYGSYSGKINITIESTPLAPINLEPASTTNQVVPDSNICFAGDYVNPSGSPMNAVEVVVYGAGALVQLWTSNTVSQSLSRFLVPYTGPALSPGQTINWKARTRATDTGFWGPYCDIQIITINHAPTTATGLSPAGSNLSTLTPTLTWQANMGDAVSHGSGPADGQGSVFSVIDIVDQSTGLSVPGFPKTTAAVYQTFAGAVQDLVTGFGWSTSNGAWTAGNFSTVPPINVTDGQAYIDTGISDGVIGAFVPYTGTGRAGILVRRYDPTNWIALEFETGSLNLIKNVAGTITTIQSVAVDIAPGQTYHLEVSLSGSTIQGYLNGNLIIAASDSFNSTKTKHGLYAHFNNTANFKDFYAASSTAGIQSFDATGAIVANNTYTWKVQTYDGYALGPFCAPVLITTNDAPSVSITSPTYGYVVTSGNLDVFWNYSSSGSYAQAHYRVIATLSGVIVYDSTNLAGTAGTLTIPTGFLLNGNHYQIAVTVTDSNGLSSTSTPITVLTLWTPPLPMSDFVATPDNTQGLIYLTWTQSTLLTSNFRRYEIRRLVTLNDGTLEVKLIAKITDEATLNFTDFYAPAGPLLTYTLTQIEAVGAEDVPSGDVVAEAYLTFVDMWFTDVVDPENYHAALTDRPARSFVHVIDEEDVKYWGRTKPVRHKGTSKYQTFTVTGELMGDDETSIYQMFLAIQTRGNVICYRDGRGRKIFANFDLSEADTLPFAYTMTFTLVEADYNEDLS